MSEPQDDVDVEWLDPDGPTERDGRFRAAFEASANGFAILELDTHVRDANRSLCDMLGFTRAQLLTREMRELAHPEDAMRTATAREQLLRGEIESFLITDKRYRHRDGHYIWVDMTATLVRGADGAPSYFIAQLTDVTARKQAEQALARHAADLERSNKELEQFAYVASHDLQQPLRTVGSYVDLLAARYYGQLDSRADRWIGFIVSGVERMQRLIDGLLMLARVRTDAEHFAPTDLAVVVTRVWEKLQESRLADDAVLVADPLPTLEVDAVQIEQLFHNLLGNACKYRRVGVTLEIRVAARELADAPGTWELRVEDNGIGIDMLHAERIFEIFQRLHREHEYGGTGIGLALCRRIVERHGGRIWVHSARGEGATFFFTLQEAARKR